jgi:peroxiredoxin
MRPDVAPGGVFPDFELPDHTGRPVRLSALMGGWPAAVVFVRGHY